MVQGTEAAAYLKTGRYGDLYVQIDRHARGKTLHVFVLSEHFNESADAPQFSQDAVEVYGIICGQPGWTEQYGWIRKGPWVEDFEALVADAKEAIRIKDEKEKAIRQEIAMKKEQYKEQILAAYSEKRTTNGTNVDSAERQGKGEWDEDHQTLGRNG